MSGWRRWEFVRFEDSLFVSSLLKKSRVSICDLSSSGLLRSGVLYRHLLSFGSLLAWDVPKRALLDNGRTVRGLSDRRLWPRKGTDDQGGSHSFSDRRPKRFGAWNFLLLPSLLTGGESLGTGDRAIDSGRAARNRRRNFRRL